MPTPARAEDLDGLAVRPDVPYPEPPPATVRWLNWDLDVYRHLYNCTWLNERGAELAVLRQFLAETLSDDTWLGRNALEVGNVCAHYGLMDPVRDEGVEVTVVDRYERARGVDNRDVFDIDGTYDLIVSVSTLEHVRWDPPEHRETGGAQAALGHLIDRLAPDGRALITVPGGHNPALDEYLATGGGATYCATLVRDMQSWRQTPELEFRPYGVTQPWAESVWIGYWGPE